MNESSFMKLTACAILLFVGYEFQIVHAADEQPPWKVGLASAKVTPDEPVRMAGYGSKEREQLSQGVASDLFAKAIAIEDEVGNKALLITTDVIGLTAAVSEPLYPRIMETTGLKREQILINSSHTHTGPAIGLDEDKLEYLNDPEHIKGTIRYTRELSDQIVTLSEQAVQRLAPAELSWGVGVATFVMNRREFTERGVRLGVNPRGLADRSVPILKIAAPDGTVRGVLIGTACHNTTLGGQDMQISGDYAGYAQQHVEGQHAGVQAMFMQGCGGDANPFPRGSEETSRIHGMTLGKEVLRVLDTELTPIAGQLTTVLGTVALPLQHHFTEDDFDKLDRASGSTRKVAQQLKEKIESGEELPTSYESRIAVWQFGEDLTLVALPGEVVVDYVRLIEDAIGPRKLWVSAYNHDVFGYLPSTRVLREGGYEMRGIYSGGFGIFAPGAERVVAEQVQALAAEAGRATVNAAR